MCKVLLFVFVDVVACWISHFFNVLPCMPLTRMPPRLTFVCVSVGAASERELSRNIEHHGWDLLCSGVGVV